MPILAGWLTGEQVPPEIIEQTLTAMGEVLGQHGGEPGLTILPGAGLIAFSDQGYAMWHNDEPPVLDWVPDRRTMVYRRPLSGIHTLYYIEDWPAEGNLLFASEIKALLAVGVPRRLHLAAIDALLRYGFIPAPWTAFRHIHVVPAGSILRWQRAKTVVNQSTEYRLDDPLSPSTTSEQLHTCIDKATADLLPPHEQLVALTGGGSASVLAALLASHHTSSPFTVASIGYTKSQTSKTWKAIEQLAHAGQHSLLAITGVDQPEFWVATLAGTEFPSVDTRPLALHQLLHTVAADAEPRIALSGLGTHLLLDTCASTSATHSTTDDPLAQYARVLSSSACTTVSSLWSPEAATLLQAEEPWEQSLHARKLARRAAQFSDKRSGLYYLDLHLRLPDLVVSPAQQLAMQERMVIRSPYLNADVLDMLTRLPAVLDDGTTKGTLLSRLLQNYLPEVADIRKKLPLLAPTASLSRIADSDLLYQLLSPEALRSTGIFDAQTVSTLIQQHPPGNSSRELLAVFTMQLLCQLFGIEL